MNLAEKIEAQRNAKQEAQERNQRHLDEIEERMRVTNEQLKVEELIEALNGGEHPETFHLYCDYVDGQHVYAIGWEIDGNHYQPLHYFPTCGEVARSMLGESK